MSFGKPMLIENIEEELDPMLDPVLEKRLIKKGKSYIMPMADKEVRAVTACTCSEVWLLPLVILCLRKEGSAVV